ncbi:MAG: GNAT family N-acetyltransferase [Chlamydiota bacterium]
MTHLKELSIRLMEEEDASYLARWLNDPEILIWYPMCNEREIEDSVRIWLGYSKLKSAFTALWNNEPCGMAVMYIQPFKKLSHQCLFAIIVAKEHRSKGVGKGLIEEMMKTAKESFNIEVFHLEVYQDNPAINLYRRLGFTEFGFQAHFIKEMGKYRGKFFMQREL